MNRPRMISCVLMSLLVLAGCGSRQQTLPPASSSGTALPAPAAWAMQYKSTSHQQLEQLFSVSESQPSKMTK